MVIYGCSIFSVLADVSAQISKYVIGGKVILKCIFHTRGTYAT